MPDSKLSAYIAQTRAYLVSPQGKANFRESRERFGYSYKRALAVAVMVATQLIVYERISAVVDALMEREAVSA
jgi:hypothetical protein